MAKIDRVEVLMVNLRPKVKRVDANQAFTIEAAIRRGRLYEPFDLAWYEEPLPAERRLGVGSKLGATHSR